MRFKEQSECIGLMAYLVDGETTAFTGPAQYLLNNLKCARTAAATGQMQRQLVVHLRPA